MAGQSSASAATNDQGEYDYVDTEEAKDVSVQDQGLGSWIARVSNVIGQISRPATEPISPAPERTPSPGSKGPVITLPQGTASARHQQKTAKPCSTRVDSEVHKFVHVNKIIAVSKLCEYLNRPLIDYQC